MARTFLFAAAILGMAAVILGAFGAHALKTRVTADMLAIWQTAIQYHFWHTLALLGVALLIRSGLEDAFLHASGWCYIAGTMIFSGSLYLLVLTDTRWLGAITPLGGVTLIAGWGLLAVSAARSL